MKYRTVFKRYELKYMLSAAQKEKIMKAMEGRMSPDSFGRTTIQNVYFDTDSYMLIRNSLDKPLYKEKLRIRSYGRADADSTVFVELKKKYDGVVYKRRVSLAEAEAMDWIEGRRPSGLEGQIPREIDSFLARCGGLKAAAFISYDREAFFADDDPDLRITFDSNIFCRSTDISLRSGAFGDRVIPEGTFLMEIKCAGAIPLWLVGILSEERIYKTTFSKYGTAYTKYIFPGIYKGGNQICSVRYSAGSSTVPRQQSSASAAFFSA